MWWNSDWFEHWLTLAYKESELNIKPTGYWEYVFIYDKIHWKYIKYE